jgi:MSHA pilin protein MshD
MKNLRLRFRARGVTLVELIVSIVIIGAALAGVTMVIVRNTSSSADPLIWHQAAIIAEAYLEEALTKEFTDPDGTNVGETRATYDNVLDYNSIVAESPPRDQNNTPIAALAGYSVNVQVIPEAFGTPPVSITNAVRVQVTVTTPTGGSIVVSGYRTNYN